MRLGNHLGNNLRLYLSAAVTVLTAFGIHWYSNRNILSAQNIVITKEVIVKNPIGKPEKETVIIGTQEWTTSNLNTSVFQNGDTIFEAKTLKEFKKAGEDHKPACCFYDCNPSNELNYGRLYNWYAVKDPRGLPPKGWHVASKEQWDTLTSSLGGEDVCGKKLRNTTGWYTNGNGDNSSGFAALPGGQCTGYSFEQIGELGFWWTSSECYSGAAYGRYLNYNYDPLKFASFSAGAGFSVRCVKD
jgi:uncharacterized protein (TIGR02145 family)